MKAIQIQQYGGVESIEFVAEAPKPSLQAGHVLVEVHAASLNRIDSKIREGYLKERLPLSFPVTLGGDFAGVVREVAEGITDVKVGDEVYGNAGVLKGGSGSLAEFVAAKTDSLSFRPKSDGFIEAAALPLVATSALQAIEEEIKLQSGQKILIQGGAGGIGSIAIQLAKMQGAYVATTVASDDIEFARNLGADEVIDYTKQDVSTVLRDFDAVFDTAGGESSTKLFAVLKQGGIFVSMVGQPDEIIAKEHSVTAIGQMTKVSTEQLKKVAKYVENGKIKVHVEKTFPFPQTKDAFVFFETQHPKGKVVVTLTE